jgi:hypothetical protein
MPSSSLGTLPRGQQIDAPALVSTALWRQQTCWVGLVGKAAHVSFKFDRAQHKPPQHLLAAGQQPPLQHVKPVGQALVAEQFATTGIPAAKPAGNQAALVFRYA